MHDPPDDMNAPPTEFGNGLTIRQVWQDQDKLPESFEYRDDLEVEAEIFHREAHRIDSCEVIFLEEANVRETVAEMFRLTADSDLPLFARTIGTLGEHIDRHQSTITTAVQKLEELPIAMRLPLQPFPAYGDIIAGIPSTLAFTKEAMDQFNKNGRQVSPPDGSRAQAVLLAFARDRYEGGTFLNDNVEALLYGEILDLLVDDEISLEVLRGRDARGVLEIVARGTAEVSDEVWELVEKRLTASVNGLATIMTFNPREKACKPSEEVVDQYVIEPDSCSCTVEKCHHWFVDFLDSGLWES